MSHCVVLSDKYCDNTLHSHNIKTTILMWWESLTLTGLAYSPPIVVTSPLLFSDRAVCENADQIPGALQSLANVCRSLCAGYCARALTAHGIWGLLLTQVTRSLNRVTDSQWMLFTSCCGSNSLHRILLCAAEVWTLNVKRNVALG